MKRKNHKKLSLVLLLALGVAVYLVACKKEIVTPINNIPVQDFDCPGYTDEAKAIVGKIRKFKEQLADRENVIRSGISVPIDSVVWNVEALFNAEYTFPDRKYMHTVNQELEFFVDVERGDEISFGAVADLYDEIKGSVRQAYSNDGINDDKSLLAVVVEKGDVVGNRAEIKVHVISGRIDYDNSIKTPAAGPFDSNDCWYFGEYGGSCDDPSLLCDAAEMIEDTINYYYRENSVPRNGMRRLHFSLFNISLDGNEYFDDSGAPYIYFYGIDDDPPLYMDYQLLNYYYYREVEVLMRILPSDPIYHDMMPVNPVFINVDIMGLLDYVGNGSCYHHKNYAVYGCGLFVPSEVLPGAIDLLD